MVKLTFFALIVLCLVCLVLFAATTMTNGGVVFKTFATHPDTPPAGGLLMWAKSDGTFQSTNSSGTDAGMGGGATGGYDPNDVTVYSHTFQLLSLASNPSSDAYPWSFTNACGLTLLTGTTKAAPSARPGMVGFVQAVSAASATCELYTPQVVHTPYGLVDFISGSTPLTHKLKVYAQRDTSGGAGTYYVGWAQYLAGNSYLHPETAFVGIKDDGANYQCVIMNGATTVNAANIAALDTAEHWFTVDNGAAVANSITCKVGAATATATGTIPAQPWGAMVAVQTGTSTTPKFNVGEARIYIAGRQAN